jgi:DNA-binding SARP family transcriptional activator
LTGPVDYRLVADLRAAVTVHPYRPRLWRQLALALYRTGRQVEALATLREAAAVRDAPDPDAEALHSAILRQDPALLAGELSPQPAATVHRLPKRR